MSNVGRLGYNNQGNRKSVWAATRWVNTDTIEPLTPTLNGVQVINGASSAKRLETSSQGAPVVVNGSAPTGAGETLIADSAVSASWGILSSANFAPDDASYITQNNNLGLTNERTGQNGVGTVLTMGGGTGIVSAESLGAAGSVISPTLTVDLLGRTTLLVENSGPWTSALGVATPLNNVALVTTARYSLFFLNDRFILNFFLDFTTDNPVNPVLPTAVDVSGLPLNPLTTYYGNCFINEDSTNSIVKTAVILTPDTGGTLRYSEGESTTLTNNTRYLVRGQIHGSIALI